MYHCPYNELHSGMKISRKGPEILVKTSYTSFSMPHQPIAKRTRSRPTGAIDVNSPESSQIRRKSPRRSGRIRRKAATTDTVHEPPRKKRKTQRPSKKSLVDPFHVLDGDIVYQIISYLPACDTEYLRRVSKSWKLRAETHCGKAVMRHHFKDPSTNGHSYDEIPAEDGNLHFRRRLYWEQSLRKGMATQATTHKDVVSWSIVNNRLLRASSDGQVTIEPLDPASKTICEFNVRTILAPDYCPIQLDLTKQGDVIAKAVRPHGRYMDDHADLFRSGNHAHSLWAQAALFKIVITQDEPCIAWRTEIDADLVGPVIGNECLYVVESCFQFRGFMNSVARIALDSGDVKERWKLRNSNRSFPGPYYELPDATGDQLVLSPDETSLMWPTPTHVVKHSTRNMQREHTFPRPLHHPIHVLDQGRRIWYPRAASNSGDEIVSYYCLEPHDLSYETSFPINQYRWILDDMPKTFAYGEVSDHTYPRCRLVIATTRGDDEKYHKKSLTLPLTQGRKRRRTFEANVEPNLDNRCSGNFLGLKDDCLIYWHKGKGDLIIFDFWPSW